MNKDNGGVEPQRRNGHVGTVMLDGKVFDLMQTGGMIDRSGLVVLTVEPTTKVIDRDTGEVKIVPYEHRNGNGKYQKLVLG